MMDFKAKKKSLLQTLTLLLVFTALALLVNCIRPNPLAWIRNPPTEDVRAGQPITLGEIQTALLQKNAVLVDARARADFDRGHAPGAVSQPVEPGDIVLSRLFSLIPREKKIIIYCQNSRCQKASRLARILRQNNYPAETIYIFEPGWEGLEGRLQSAGSGADLK
jgi:rhodanese-related sulfurtransferase